MKFLFIYPSSGKWEMAPNKLLSTGAYFPPLGILYLAKILEMNGYNAKVIDCNAEKVNEDKLKAEIRSSDAIGITTYSEPRELINSIKLSIFIKEYDPDIPLVIGGPHCSLCPIRSLHEHHADICVTGEGEHIITPLVEAIEGKRKLSTIPGIYYKEGNRIKKTEPAKQIDDLDAIPFPARHLVDKYEYGFMLGSKIAKGKITSILTSRGCPHGCRFCQLCFLTPKYRTRSANNITKEIEEVVNAGYKTLVFVDDNLLTQQKKIMKIMDFIIQKEMNIYLWIANARVDSTDRRLYEKMRDAGVESISFGIESGNQDVLDFYDKRITLEQIRKAVQLSKEMGFFVSANFILGAPIETEKHIKNTIKFAKSLPLDSAIFYNLGYLYKSPLWNEAYKEGKIKENEYWVIADSKRGLGNFTEEELIDYSMKAYRSFYFNHRLWMRELYYAFAKKDFRFLKIGLKMLI
jgi:anaerobic magnesium-protoporphyrin IX monomethyl ester cyclase